MSSNVSGLFPDPEIPNLDDEALMVPPWIKYPNIAKGSIGCRMGIGEQYFRQLFPTWWSQQIRAIRLRVREKYPAPEGWSDFYSGL